MDEVLLHRKGRKVGTIGENWEFVNEGKLFGGVADNGGNLFRDFWKVFDFVLELPYFCFLDSVWTEVAFPLSFANYFGVNPFGHFSYTVSDELKVI